jgi:hypothetical protein
MRPRGHRCGNLYKKSSYFRLHWALEAASVSTVLAVLLGGGEAGQTKID